MRAKSTQLQQMLSRTRFDSVCFNLKLTKTVYIFERDIAEFRAKHKPSSFSYLKNKTLMLLAGPSHLGCILSVFHPARKTEAQWHRRGGKRLPSLPYRRQQRAVGC